jgi:hypothetical protein
MMIEIRGKTAVTENLFEMVCTINISDDQDYFSGNFLKITYSGF